MSWYAIKTRPGTQRPATPRVGEIEDRKGEFIIERNVGDADLEIFMPSFRKYIKHHRTKELIERRFAMITGYSFVYLPTRDFYRLSRVDGVTAILGVAGYPLRISDFEVESLRDAEAMADSALQRERDAAEPQAIAGGVPAFDSCSGRSGTSPRRGHACVRPRCNRSQLSKLWSSISAASFMSICRLN